MEEKSETIIFASFLSLLAHLILVIGMSFSLPEPDPVTSMDLLLTFDKAKEEPLYAEHKAAAAQEPSGEAKENIQARVLYSPFIVSLDFLLQSQLVVSEFAQEQDPTLIRKNEVIKDDLRSTSKYTVRDSGSLGADSNSRILSTSRQAIQARIMNIEASLGALEEEHAKRPRIKRYTSIVAQSALEAEYIYRWVTKIETVGNLNYPSRAVEEKVDGSLRLLVALDAEGNLVDLRLLQSSGYRLLDDAARYIVRLAEPFEPFPTAIEEQVDIIEIVRTWQFFSAGRRVVFE